MAKISLKIVLTFYQMLSLFLKRIYLIYYSGNTDIEEKNYSKEYHIFSKKFKNKEWII